MAKKEKENSKIELKAGDIIETEKGESFELDAAQAASLNEQLEEKEEKADAKASKEKNLPVNGTFRFKKFNK